MLLTSTSDKVTLTTSAAGDVEVHASYVNYDGTTVTTGRKNSNITTATTTDIVDVPPASTTRNVKVINIANTHASTANTVTLTHTDGTTPVQLEQITLAAGERMTYREGVPMRIIDALGRERIQGVAASSGSAITAQIASHSADTYYNGLLVGGRLQAGSFA